MRMQSSDQSRAVQLLLGFPQPLGLPKLYKNVPQQLASQQEATGQKNEVISDPDKALPRCLDAAGSSGWLESFGERPSWRPDSLAKRAELKIKRFAELRKILKQHLRIHVLKISCANAKHSVAPGCTLPPGTSREPLALPQPAVVCRRFHSVVAMSFTSNFIVLKVFRSKA